MGLDYYGAEGVGVFVERVVLGRLEGDGTIESLEPSLRLLDVLPDLGVCESWDEVREQRLYFEGFEVHDFFSAVLGQLIGKGERDLGVL